MGSACAKPSERLLAVSGDFTPTTKTNQKKMGDEQPRGEGRGGFGRGRGRGDRGRGDRGRGDRGRGDRGRGRGGRDAGETEEWVPCTKLGRLVRWL